MAEIPASEDGQSAEYITTIVKAQIKPGKEDEYEQWLHGINEDATQFAGFQGVTILRPDDESHQHPEYVIVVRFAAYSDLRRWEHSSEFAEWQHRLEPLLAGDIAVDRLTGTETWFTLPGHTVVVPPPKYKMAVVAAFGAAPFVLIVIPLMVKYLNGVLPSIGISIAILLVMSFAMTWVTMPALTRLARRWLYPTK